MSRMMLGLRPRDLERAHPELWTGISMFDSLAVAQARARQLPQLGPYIATVNIGGIDPRQIVVSPPGSSGHYTVWAAPEYFLAAVLAIQHV